MVARYYELCDQRDALYAKVQPLEDRITVVNAEIEAKRIEAEGLAKQIEEGLGGPQFIELKKEIAQIAAFLRKIPPRPDVTK